MKVIIALCVLTALALADPLPPKWPPVFNQDFHEINTYPGIGDLTTDGQFYYDATTSRYRVDRNNGFGDRYCWLQGWKFFKLNHPCSHIVYEGKRYLYYPDSKSCCYCCGAEHGCGILKQDWLQNAKFLGEVEIDGQKAYKWDKQGLQSNFYYETIAENPEDRIQLQTNQGTNDQMTFDKSSFYRYIPNGHLDLPNVCIGADTCATISVCTAARAGAVSLKSILPTF